VDHHRKDSPVQEKGKEILTDRDPVMNPLSSEQEEIMHWPERGGWEIQLEIPPFPSQGGRGLRGKEGICREKPTLGYCNGGIPQS